MSALWFGEGPSICGSARGSVLPLLLDNEVLLEGQVVHLVCEVGLDAIAALLQHAFVRLLLWRQELTLLGVGP